MAIIRASKTFEGGDLSQRTSTYIKPGTRLVDFKNKENGVYLFILGAYKQDKSGAGVWYRPLHIRDNFGMGLYKKKFAIQPNCPIEYFANKVQTFAPNMAKSTETRDDNNRVRWIYPAWGRSTWRVLYNAAIFKDFGSGVHVLDLPQSGGAAVIDEYVKGHQADGSENPDLTNYEAAIPVNIKLDLKVAGQPWKIRIDNSKTFVLPVELADTEYLYNLDDVINYPSKDSLIEELKSIVPTDIFKKGMEGYDDGKVSADIDSTPEPVVEKPTAKEIDEIPMTFANPMASIPKSTIAPNVVIPKANSNNATSSIQEASAPVVGTNAAMAAAASYLRSKTVK